MRSYDAIIIGAGLAGTSTAYHLSRLGLARVLLLEQEHTFGVHSSGRNAAIARQVVSDGALARMTHDGVRFLEEPAERAAAEQDGAGRWTSPVELLCPTGLLLLGSEAVGGTLDRVEQASRSAGIALERLGQREVSERYPVLRGSGDAGGILSPDDGVVDVHALMSGFIREARRTGLEVETANRVTGFLREGSAVQGVRLGSEGISAGVVVNAAGAWAQEIGRLAGAESLPLKVTRRHLFLMRSSGEVPGPVVWHDDAGLYFRREGDALLMSPCDEEPHPPGIPPESQAALELLAGKVAETFPALGGLELVRGWAGLRILTPDGRHILGPDPRIRGLFWAAGLGGHGVTTAYTTGRMVARCVTGKAPVAGFDPARFA
jgi:D-arginine dehydrogenase